MMSENSIAILNYAKENEGKDFTHKDIAAALGLSERSVTGSITALCNKKDADKNPMPLLERVPAEIENEDGTHATVKLIKITEAGKAFDPEA